MPVTSARNTWETSWFRWRWASHARFLYMRTGISPVDVVNDYVTVYDINYTHGEAACQVKSRLLSFFPSGSLDNLIPIVF